MKKVKLNKGKYVLAVSGGVDSVVLLNVLSKQPDIQLVVAHFDHGIRLDSKKDRVFTGNLAKTYGLHFEYGEGNLGGSTSEAQARAARYHFLRSVQKRHKADAIVTAHHQDDVLETLIINVIRGTGRKGLSSLVSNIQLQRPLLDIPKKDLYNYAKKNGLKWREDPTNKDQSYTRNWVRHTLLPKLSLAERKKLLQLQKNSRAINENVDMLIEQAFIDRKHTKQLVREQFIVLDHNLAKEVLAAWLRVNKITFDAKLIEKLVPLMKSLHVGKTVSLPSGVMVKIEKTVFTLLVGVKGAGATV